MQDTARLVVCSERGDIIVCENSGEFYTFVDRDESQKIKCIVAYNRGFLIGWSNNMISAYERYEDPYTGISTYKKSQIHTIALNNPYQLMNYPVSSMVLTQTEDLLFFITENN